MDFISKNDGSGRPLRPVQIQALTWLQDNWSSADAFTMQLPVASGKSLIAKAIANATGGSIVTPSNLLITQYTDTYKATNFLKGKQHYKCVSSGLSCHDWCNALEQKACKDCPYTAAKKRALRGEQTFYNPMSLFYAGMSQEWKTAPVLIVDEAHQLPGMISMLCGVKLRHSMYKFNDSTLTELHLVPFLQQQVRNLSKLALYYDKDKKRLAEITDELERLKLVLLGVETDASNYAIWIEQGLFRGKPDRFLCVKPIRPPRSIVNSVLDGKKIVLLSGTLMPSDVQDLVGERRILSLDLPSPIPKERRKVFYKPLDFKMNRDTAVAPIVDAIESIIAKHPGKNAIVHVSYAMSKRLRKAFNIPILYNDPENKQKVLDKFIREGGVFLASGCAEGIDLKYDLARVTIIPKLLFPNLGDPVVSKRKSLEDGDVWFNCETLKTTIQQAGRSTRTEDDYSDTYILDPNFARIWRKTKHLLPASFNESLVWSSRD